MKALYTAASGMSAQQTKIDTIANNLANVSTAGFKKSRETFTDLFYQELTTGGASQGTTKPATAQVGSGVQITGVERDHSQGTLTQTGSTEDLAIEGRGFFAVETPQGQQLFTRSGQFSTNDNGQLVTAQGLALSGGVDLTGVDSWSVAADGTVTGTYPDSAEEVSLGQIELVDFVNPGGLEALGDGLFAETSRSGSQQAVDMGVAGKIRQGYIESSNVDVAEELVNMIMTQRAYELNSKVVQAADETMQMVASLRR